MAKQLKSTDKNPDPITGQPGAHPVGVGVGAALAGAAAGAAGGAVAGPVGTIAGAAIGGIAGGYAGKAVEESIDPTAEDAYWRENFGSRDYVETGSDYETYRPAYQYGWESRGQFAGRRFDDVEPDLQRNWPKKRGKSAMAWDQAKQAARDAWDRVETAMPGDADGDGK
jgi:hypothetical protein